MIMKSGERWHCTNSACRCEVLVQTNSEIDGTNPRCVCGALMKKKYVPPHATYLEFLRLDEPVTAQAEAPQEVKHAR
ncbi:MAG: hypothetical protein WA817_01330 [Candidatus Acidiferrum sp.]